MQILKLLLLCLLFNSIDADENQTSVSKGKLLRYQNVDIVTVTSFTVRPTTTTLTLPFCTYTTTTRTIYEFCAKVTGGRKRRSGPTDLPLLEEEDKSRITTESSLSLSINTDHEGSTVDPRNLNIAVGILSSTWTNVITSTIVSLSLISSTTTTTIAQFFITTTSVSTVTIADLMDDMFQGVPRC